MSDGGGLWEWPPVSAAAGGLSGCLLGAPPLLPRSWVISHKFILFLKPAVCPRPYSQQEACGPTLKPPCPAPGARDLVEFLPGPAAPSQQGRSRDGPLGRPGRSEELAREAGRAEGLLLSRDIPRPGPGAAFPGPSGQEPSLSALVGGGCACLARPGAWTRQGVLLCPSDRLSAAAARLPVDTMRGVLAGTGQPAGVRPCSKRCTASPPNNLASPKFAGGETEAQSVKCLAQAQMPLGGGFSPGACYMEPCLVPLPLPAPPVRAQSL